MTLRKSRAAALSLALALPSQAAKDDHPVAKVITMLKGLDEKVDAEAKEEALTYEKFEYWCGNSQKKLKKTIKEGKATLGELAEEIESHELNIETLTNAIAKLVDELTELSKADTAAQKDRTAGADLYTEESTSLTGTVSAIKQAIAIMEGAQTSTESLVQAKKQVRSMLALLGTSISSAKRSALESFADPDRERPELEAKGDHKDHVDKYAFKSSSVIELLKGLQDDFEKQLVKRNKEETNAINAFELAKAARQDLVNAATKSKGAKETEKTTSEGDLGTAKQAQSDAQGDLGADTKTLGETEKSCRVKKSEWEERSATRAGEREAIKAAIGILSKVTGVRTDAPSNPVPPASPVEATEPSFLQLSKGNPSVLKAVELLRKQARLVHSGALDKLVQMVAGLADPEVDPKTDVTVTQRVKHGDQHFDQVINMIQKMIFRLQNEQTEEDNHKHWCDKELEKTNTSIVDKDDKLEELKAKIDEATARVGLLTTEIVDANDMVADITKHMKDATGIRKIGKKENALAVKDSEDAQTAIANAVAVLKDFYKSSGEIPKESWEFLQEPVTLPDHPSTWDSEYTGVADADKQPGGIVTVLEEVSSDFAKMQAETEAQEESDQDAYQQDMKDCDIEKARRAKEAEMKEQEKKRLLEKLEGLQATHKGVSKEHEATVQYLADLQHACVDGDSTYDDRKAARSGEIDALKEAQGILQTAFDEEAAPPPKKPPAFLEIRRH